MSTQSSSSKPNSTSASASNSNSPSPRASTTSFLGDHPNLQAVNPVVNNTTVQVPPTVTVSSPSPSSNNHDTHALTHHISESAPSTLSAASGAAALVMSSASMGRSQSSDQLYNMELNSHTSPAVPYSHGNRYPAIPRFTPSIPTRMSGTDRSSYSGHHIYPRSASSSPPGTPPNGLRSVYLNAALQRSQHNMHLPGAGRTSSSPRPPHLQMPQQYSATVQLPPPLLTKRSYSADQLAVPEEPEIMVTSPGGTNEVASTQEHVLKLDRALSNLIESQENEDRRNGGDGEDDTDGPIIMKSSKKNKGLSKFPKIVHDRLGPEKVAAITGGSSKNSSANNSANNTPPEMRQSMSDLTLDLEKDKVYSEKDKVYSEKESGQQQQQQKEVSRRKSVSRMSRMFGRDHVAAAHLAAAAIGGTQDTNLTYDRSFQPQYLSRQPTKGGVLSNLLKLQAGARRQQKSGGHREHKEKKKDKAKRPCMYPRSANNSVHNILGTYPPLPNTNNGQATTTGIQSSANGNTTHRSNHYNNNQRYSLQYDPSSMISFPPAHSPIQSPNASPRGSFSGDMTPTYVGSLTDSLTAEEKLRITFAVADILERQDYILRLARAMIRYGAPSHRLEDAIDSSARTLEINLQCVYLPNVMVIAFTDYETHTSETHLLKVSAGLDMYKFAQVHQVLKMVTHSVMSVEEAIMKLDAINTEKDIIPRWATILAFATASFCTAPMFFKGGWVDAGVAVLMGTTVGLMTWLSERVPSYSKICEVTMSVLVALVAEGLQQYVCRSSVKMAGIVMLLPGYTITTSILELSSHHMISGSVRLFYAIIFSLLLGYGLTIGSSLWKLISGSGSTQVDPSLSSVCPTTLDPIWNILFVPLFAISLNIWLKAHPRQWPLACVLSILGYVVSWSTLTYAGAGSEVSSALASFAIGFVGNVYQRLTHQLTFQAVVCAVFFLVPGSLGLKGSMALFTEDMIGGANFALQMVVTAIAISVGLFAASLVVYPMGKTRSAQMTF